MLREIGLLGRLAVASSLVACVATVISGPAIASPVLGDPCPNGDIRKAQGTSYLPDCLALEQVSAQQKLNTPARVFSASALQGGDVVGAAGSGGDRLLYLALGAIGDTPGFENVLGDPYVASRNSQNDRWETHFTSPPPHLVRGWTNVPDPRAFAADLSTWFHVASSRAQYESGLGQPFRGGLGGVHEIIGPLLTPLSGSPEGGSGNVRFLSRGSSADGSRLFLTSDHSITYLPGDPTPSLGADPNTYIAALDALGNPSLRLMARDLDGKVWGGSCGALPGGNPNPQRNGGAISVDGSRVYLTTRPDQPANGACDTAHQNRIMVREETPAGPAISELFESECDRVADPGPPEILPCGKTATGPAPPPGGNTVPDGDDTYQGASIDGNRVYFTTPRQLVDSDVNGLESFGFNGCVGSFGLGIGGCDLYLHDATKPAGQRLTQITAGSTGQTAPSVVAVSGDGSRVYFNFAEVLTLDPGPGISGTAQAGQNNLYVYDAEADEISFIARTEVNFAATASAWAVPVLGPDPEALGVGGDGRRLVFTSSAALTADDADGGFRDVFRYDAEAETLVRISRANPGGSDNGPFDVFVGRSFGGTERDQNSPNVVGFGRWVSEDGETIAFKTIDGLAGEDNNGILDSYVSRGGSVFRLPGTTDPTNGTVVNRGLQDRPIVAPDGDTVFFQTFERLLPSDGDTASDVYAVRVDGGFHEPQESQLCAPDGGTSCQGPAGSAPTGAAALSETLVGSGNLSARPAARCNRNQVRRGGRCVAKRVLANRACSKRKGKARKRCVRNRIQRLNRVQQRQLRAEQRRTNTDRRAGK